MNFYRVLLFKILFLIILPICSYAQNNKQEKHYKLTAVLKNASFDTLYLYNYTDEADCYITGNKGDTYTWTFLVPDSIIHDLENIALVSSKFNPSTRSSKWIRFVSKNIGRGELTVSNIGFEDEENYIYATYRDSSVYVDSIAAKVNGKDTIVANRTITENFILENNDEHSDIVVRSQSPNFCWFFDPNNENKTYEDFLDEYESLARKYPDSRFLLMNLSSNLLNFKTREDAKRVFDHLSRKHFDSKWGNRITLFLSDKFINLKLPSLTETICEKIVQDSTKYNLLIFTASWCAPCIAEIPVLKRIYNNVKEKMIFTFINLDNEKGLKTFIDIVLEKNEIPWRTLYAFNDLDNVKKQYIVDAIPMNLLIAPDGSYQRIDVRKEEHERIIYTSIGLNEIKSEK